VIIAGIYLLTIIEGQMFRDYHGLDVAQRKDMLQAIGAQASGSVDVPRYLRTIVVPAAKTIVDRHALENPWNITKEQIQSEYENELSDRIRYNYTLYRDYERNLSEPDNKMYVSSENLTLVKYDSSNTSQGFDLIQNRTTMFYPQRIKDVRGKFFTGSYKVGMPWGNESVVSYNYSIGMPNNIEQLVVAAREVWNRSVEDWFNMSEINNRSTGGWKIAADYLNETHDSGDYYSPGDGLESGAYPEGDVGYDDITGFDHNSIVFYGWRKASEHYPRNQMPSDLQNEGNEISKRIVQHTWNYANLTFSPPEWDGPSYGNFTDINGNKQEIIVWGLNGTSIVKVAGGYDQALSGS
jgi:hypothetical protein